MLEVGLKGVEKTVVDKTNTAAAIGSGGLEVFYTKHDISYGVYL